MSNPYEYDPERLARVETLLEQTEKELLRNGALSSEGIRVLSDKLDAMDAKWDTRFTKLEADQRSEMKQLASVQAEDARELQALKNKGAGVLAAIGFVFTITATIFADFFAHVKDVVFG